MNTKPQNLLAYLVAFFFVALFALGLSNPSIFPDPQQPLPPVQTPDEIKAFTSPEEFTQYINQAQALANTIGGFGGGRIMNAMPQLDTGMPAPMGMPSSEESAAPQSPDRVSTTNVQVAGIDEPDIVKTDGKEMYVSLPRMYALMQESTGGFMREGFEMESKEGATFEKDILVPDLFTTILPSPMPPTDIWQPPPGGIRAVKAFPPSALALDGTIEKSGNMLLHNNILAVFPDYSFYGTDSDVFAYDVADPAHPKEQWHMELKNNTQVVTARLMNDTLYIVTQTGNYNYPCPITPFAMRGQDVIIPCYEIYHPISVVPADATYTISAIDPMTGIVRASSSFVGSADSSQVYMSPEALYLAYYVPPDVIEFSVRFFQENKDLFPADIVVRLEKLQTYDISQQAKLVELEAIFEGFEASLEQDARLRLENELANRAQHYAKAHLREFEHTGIVRFDLPGLGTSAVGKVSGRLLNQFSLDEYQRHLRVATTVGESSIFGFGFGSSESENDVYVLDAANLRMIGSVLGMGLTERIYAARFVEDKGYLVTFRQTDPFYVLDLSDPANPKRTGELKIPGYSSYLHPINNDLIVGVGDEGGQVKISLFDVRNSAQPQEAAKYLLNEYWTEVSSTHHAFLLDQKHQIFFLPGGQGGYIFSYRNNALELLKAVSGIQARRAIFINDYLYIVGDDRIIVLDETNWERVNELSL